MDADTATHPRLLDKGEPRREASWGRRARGRGPWVQGQRGGPKRVLGCGGAGVTREGRAQTSGSERPQARPARGSPHGGWEVGLGRRDSAGSQGLGSGSCSPGRGQEAGPGSPRRARSGGLGSAGTDPGGSPGGRVGFLVGFHPVEIQRSRRTQPPGAQEGTREMASEGFRLLVIKTACLWRFSDLSSAAYLFYRSDRKSVV